MMPLSREEKEELVRDLYFNKGKTYHEIAKEARVSLRDIKGILNKGTEEEGEKQSLSKAAQAYEMFSEGKSPMEVAIALDLREPEVTQLYKESWTLRQIYDLNQIYLETGGNLAAFLKLYKLSKAAGYNAGHVVWLLGAANNDMPRFEYRYHNLKSEVASLESKKQNLVGIIQQYDGQATALGKTLDNYCVRCEQEEKKLANLQTKRMGEESLVTQFENNNVEYIKLIKTVEEKVRATLSNRKKLLKLAAFSLLESIRENPSKYSSLIQHDVSSTTTTDYTIPDFNPFYYMCGQQQRSPQKHIQSKVYFIEDYVVMLLEDADKLFEELVKKLGDEVIRGYAASTSTSSSLPAPLQSHEDSLIDKGEVVV